MPILLPGSARPTNLHVSDGGITNVVTSDMYDICKRVAELSERLFIVEHHRPSGVNYTVMERCDDGWDRIVTKHDALDERVLAKIRYIMGVPLEVRLAHAEEVEAEAERKVQEDSLDDLYENLGRPMLHQLHKDGFTDHNPKSFAKPHDRRRG